MVREQTYCFRLVTFSSYKRNKPGNERNLHAPYMIQHIHISCPSVLLHDRRRLGGISSSHRLHWRTVEGSHDELNYARGDSLLVVLCGSLHFLRFTNSRGSIHLATSLQRENIPPHRSTECPHSRPHGHHVVEELCMAKLLREGKFHFAS